jgi:RimJ/RimL family protein N-acetyltransferase
MILGEWVRLRPIERADLPRFVAWFGDPEVRQHLALYRPMGLEEEERWFEKNLEAGDTQAWAIDARETHESTWVHIGSCGFHHIDWRNRSGEIGIVIGVRAEWGRGRGTEAVRALVSWGFRTLGLHRIYLKVFADNARAIRCYEKVGFRLEGRMREDSLHEGRYRDTLLMGILRAEFTPPNAATP